MSIEGPQSNVKGRANVVSGITETQTVWGGGSPRAEAKNRFAKESAMGDPAGNSGGPDAIGRGGGPNGGRCCAKSPTGGKTCGAKGAGGSENMVFEIAIPRGETRGCQLWGVAKRRPQETQVGWATRGGAGHRVCQATGVQLKRGRLVSEGSSRVQSGVLGVVSTRVQRADQVKGQILHERESWARD